MNLFRRLLIPTFALSVIVYILHMTALKLSFYWVYWWFDMVLHTLTGFVLTLLILFIIYRLFPDISLKNMYISTLIVFLIIAIAWEVFEYVNGFALTHGSYILDTLSDILLGILGGYVAVRYVLTLIEKKV